MANSLPHGSVDRTKVICMNCRYEMSCHQSALSLKYHELPSRGTTVGKIHDLYSDEKAKVEEALGQANTVALTGDYRTSLGNHNYLGVTAHYFDPYWKLNLHALTVMKTEDRHYADTCAKHFMQVAEKWDIESKVSTLTTDSARNMIAAARKLLFEWIPCIAHQPRSINDSFSAEQPI